ncbi:uncharacterized protein ASCRUDRAFT_67786 [Ascoidea rubescens DSM 1968]|uniref:Uncharacterized protein n=1 Tax=Ascoidea rubescens DSM 1968 TaxID=1344418 RepID=A0A1D2VQ23_9ASCO|nr:hypothetical protein ASCRUDRAFT_67786 [Ascoidea rubescens DSM 1968]ODV63711.1 hypothetical protein ASCRUDRAFT_67786 [Ascoidea rubescens DSM 1968]
MFISKSSCIGFADSRIFAHSPVFQRHRLCFTRICSQFAPIDYRKLGEKYVQRFGIYNVYNLAARDKRYLQQLLIDLIENCRKLEHTLLTGSRNQVATRFNRGNKPQLKSEAPEKVDDFLYECLTKNNSIRSFLLDKDNEFILRKYLITDPIPKNENTIKMISSYVSHAINHNAPISEKLIYLSLRQLLKNEKSVPFDNFISSFEIVDLLYGKDSNYTKFLKSKFIANFIIPLSAVSIILLPLSQIIFLSSTYLNIGLMLIQYSMNIGFFLLFSSNFFLKQTSRIKWLNGTNWFRCIIHQNELLMINRIITYFDEFYDLNVENYHLIGSSNSSKNNGLKSLNHFRANNNFNIEFFLENHIDDIKEINSIDQTKPKNEEELELLKFIIKNLRNRKMILRTKETERQFYQFWSTRGENFEWIEPDQDPAEMILLKMYKK